VEGIRQSRRTYPSDAVINDARDTKAHRPVQIPSLWKTFHLVGPGWSAFGAGEPALPGIAVGHNDRIGFGFTIVVIDQTLKPEDPNRYLYKGQWRRMETEHDAIAVKGRHESVAVTMEYTVHGPVIYKDPARHRAFALGWVSAVARGTWPRFR
jgi:penicillin amidase